MCNNDWTVTDGHSHADIVAEGEGGRAVRSLKSVIDVICSSQTLGLEPGGETCPHAFASQQRGLPQPGSPFLLEATGYEPVPLKGKGSCLSSWLP